MRWLVGAVNALVGIEDNRVSAVRAQLREMAHQHANEVWREMEITLYTTHQRRVWFTPEGAS